uniref:CWH43-like N-terminal domain-containing protein n=1 Tax=Ditylenchus dipsaci TaxID=166011 RepID=A0A915DMF5_9BILA
MRLCACGNPMRNRRKSNGKQSFRGDRKRCKKEVGFLHDTIFEGADLSMKEHRDLRMSSFGHSSTSQTIPPKDQHARSRANSAKNSRRRVQSAVNIQHPNVRVKPSSNGRSHSLVSGKSGKSVYAIAPRMGNAWPVEPPMYHSSPSSPTIVTKNVGSGDEPKPSVFERFAPIHPRRQWPEYEVKELMRINPLHLFFIGFLPPFFGAVASIGEVAIPVQDNQLAYGADILAVHFSIPHSLRVVELGVGFVRYGRLRSVDCRFPRLYTLSRYLYAVFGTFELIFMVALSVVGEREFIAYHVFFFYAFGCFAVGFFITNAVCHASSLYYLNPYGRISYYVKVVVTILYFISVPILFGAFVLYWKKCITIMYDVFAITEYVDVFLSMAYHCCAFSILDTKWSSASAMLKE